MARRTWERVREAECGWDEEQLALAYAGTRSPELRAFCRRVFEGLPAPEPEVAEALHRRTERLRLCASPEAGRALGELCATLVLADSPLVRPGDPALEHWLTGVATLADLHGVWLRAPGGWSGGAGDPAGELGSLARWLLARYPVPGCCDSLLTDRRPELRPEWFAHLGAGGNLRTAPGLSVRLTSRMAHLALESPAEAGFLGALRRGQVLGLAGGEALARAVAGAWPGRTLLPSAEEAWWATAFQWLVNHPGWPAQQVGPLLDYLRARRWREPGFSLKGRGEGPLRRALDRWHRELAARAAEKAEALARLRSSGLIACSYRGPDGNTWDLVELVSEGDLEAEGASLRHCAASYAGQVRNGRCSIWSLRRLERGRVSRAVTLEVDSYAHAVVQVRGLANRGPAPWELALVTRWARDNGLTVRL